MEDKHKESEDRERARERMTGKEGERHADKTETKTFATRHNILHTGDCWGGYTETKSNRSRKGMKLSEIRMN